MTGAPDYITKRQAEFDRAERFLKSKCILVDPTDRRTQVRRYRVSGVAETLLAEGVIEYAVSLGFEREVADA